MFEVLSKTSEVNWFLLKELNPGGTYSVSMRGTSLHFLSNYTEPSFITLTSDMFSKSAVFCEETASFFTEVYASHIEEICAKNDTCSYGYEDRVVKAGLITGTFLLGVLIGVGGSGAVVCVVCWCRRKSVKAKETSRCEFVCVSACVSVYMSVCVCVCVCVYGWECE